MAFVKRDVSGQIVAVSSEKAEGFDELLTEQSEELQAFLTAMGQQSALAQSDLEFIRVLDDLLSVLLDKNLLLFTELPEDAQRKIAERSHLRKLRRGALNILDPDQLF
jgi:hypothetical protein